MNGFIIAFIVVYCLVLCTYFITETSGKLYLRAPNKIVLAVMFFAFACVQFNTKTTYFSINNYTVLLIIGIFLAALGDIMLLFDFKVGGTFFLSGNACLFFYYLCLMTDNGYPISKWWWLILIIVAMTAAWTISFYKSKRFDFKGKKEMPIIMSFYLMSVIAHGITSIALTTFLPCQFTALLCAGSILFMLSDFALTINLFVNPNKWILRLNSALYFTGLLLIVLSMALI